MLVKTTLFYVLLGIGIVSTTLSSSIDAIRMPKNDEPVIIVGGGLAGLSSAIEVIESGASVIIIEKEANFGGNSAKATSGISASGTLAQEALQIKDSPEKFYLDTLAAGDNKNDVALVNILVHQSKDAITFLANNGANLSDVNLCGGHSVPRLHWIPPLTEGRPIPVGLSIIQALKAKLFLLKERYPERVDILLNTTAIGLVTWNDYITGIRYLNADRLIEEVKGKAVILATGGFSNDHDEKTSLLAEFTNPDIAKLPTSNGLFSTGDGIKMARGMGASIIGMENVQIHPTAFVDPNNTKSRTKFLAAEALRGKGAILLNQKGQRFGNELDRRDYLTKHIRENCEKDDNGWHISYLIVNDAVVDSFGRLFFNFYAETKKFFQKVKNVDELAELLQCDKNVLKDTFEYYNSFANNTDELVQDKFGKTVFPVTFNWNESFYVAKTTPAIHYTMGGLKIDTKGYVFSDFMNKHLKGLLAAGEITGGVHGQNRLAGNSLLECIVFGRIAGRSAAEIYSHDEL